MNAQQAFANPIGMIRTGSKIKAHCEVGGMVQIVGSGGDKYVAIAIKRFEKPVNNGNLTAELCFKFVRVGPTGKCPKGWDLIPITDA